jgi:hypothetical protein
MIADKEEVAIFRHHYSNIVNVREVHKVYWWTLVEEFCQLFDLLVEKWVKHYRPHHSQLVERDWMLTEERLEEIDRMYERHGYFKAYEQFFTAKTDNFERTAQLAPVKYWAVTHWIATQLCEDGVPPIIFWRSTHYELGDAKGREYHGPKILPTKPLFIPSYPRRLLLNELRPCCRGMSLQQQLLMMLLDNDDEFGVESRAHLMQTSTAPSQSGQTQRGTELAKYLLLGFSRLLIAEILANQSLCE